MLVKTIKNNDYVKFVKFVVWIDYSLYFKNSMYKFKILKIDILF